MWIHIHVVVTTNTKRSRVYFTQFPPVVTSGKILVQYHNWVSTLIQLRFRTLPSSQRSVLLAFYSHTHLLAFCPPSPLNPWQPPICSSFLRYLPLLRKLYKWKHTASNLLGLPLPTHISMGIHSGWCMYQQFVPLY